MPSEPVKKAPPKVPSSDELLRDLGRHFYARVSWGAINTKDREAMLSALEPQELAEIKEDLKPERFDPLTPDELRRAREEQQAENESTDP